jgi:hypothetical protein
MEASGDQRLILELTVDARRRLLDRFHERLTRLAAGKWIAATEQIVREKTADRAGNRGLAVGIIALTGGSAIKCEAES